MAIAEIISVIEKQGAERYGSEKINQLEHALQCAWLAEKESGDPALITAALLHDIGHMLHQLGEDAALRGVDDRHEVIGYKYLRRHFGDDVCLPVKLHVDAKRYLCAVDDDYFGTLSEGSVRSLELQGGTYSEAEAEEFIRQPLARDAVNLRIWDDLAKIPDLETPDVPHFLPFVESCYRSDEKAA